MTDVRVLDDAPWLRSGPAARVLEILNGNGEEARVVGGSVRNALLDMPIHEIDVATTAVPEEVVRRVTAAGVAAAAFSLRPPPGARHSNNIAGCRGRVPVRAPGTPPPRPEKSCWRPMAFMLRVARRWPEI